MITRYRKLTVTLLAVANLTICLTAHAGDDAKLLQGKWRVVSAKDNGGELRKDIGKVIVIIDKDEMVVQVEGTKSEQGARFVLDPKKSPKQIDFPRATRDTGWGEQLAFKLFKCWKLEKGEFLPADDMAQGIYKLEGDTLTLCWRATKGKEIRKDKVGEEPAVRPTLFQSHLYYHQFLFVLKRAKD